MFVCKFTGWLGRGRLFIPTARWIAWGRTVTAKVSGMCVGSAGGLQAYAHPISNGRVANTTQTLKEAALYAAVEGHFLVGAI
eukprot:9212309-Pyramimonas_sp.AAC.1